MQNGRTILDWSEADVHDWFSSALGLTQFQREITEHNISGEILSIIDSAGLLGAGISSLGHRLTILKSVYQLKLAQNIPFGEDDYIPPSEANSVDNSITIQRLHEIVQQQAQRLKTLEDENKSLSQHLQSINVEFSSIRSSIYQPAEQTQTNGTSSSLHRQPSFQWAQYDKPVKSPTKSPTRPEITVHESPNPSPQQSQFVPTSSSRPQPNREDHSSSSSASASQTLQPPKPSRNESSDTLKSFKVSLEDPTWKVLPAALKKYRINNDSWQNYAMFICYGPMGNRIDRCLSYDEKPLLLFQRLKDAKKEPVFMLKHIKDIRSPIAVAQQKHAARRASSLITNGSESGATTGHHHIINNQTQTNNSNNKSSSSSQMRPPKLQVTDLANGDQSNTLSPIHDPNHQRSDDMSMTPLMNKSNSSLQHDGTLAAERFHNSSDPSANDSNPNVSQREIPTASGNLSYAVAIYPYMAEQDDEFDVVVGDTFVVVSRARGWWVVQKDPQGTGVVDLDKLRQGWVPAGCLLETNVPVATAIEQAQAANADSNSSGTPPGTPLAKKTPILPLSILSTSFPGIALMDYNKKGEEELDLNKGDTLRVFKRYNHWSYAVKEEGGDRGWVPSWFIGKISSSSNLVPATPITSVPPNIDDPTQAQVSPMSSAFPVHKS